MLSDLVNKPIPEWDRKLTDEELHGEMMADIFVGGSETTTNALSAGVVMLIEKPEIWEALSADPDKYLPVFIEEVVRLETPVQGLLREVARRHRAPRSGAARRFGAEHALRRRQPRRPRVRPPGRRRPGATKARKGHLGYGFGAHFCLGAALARRELFWGFKGLVDRVESIRYAPDPNTFEYHPNYFLRALKELRIGFRAAS